MRFTEFFVLGVGTALAFKWAGVTWKELVVAGLTLAVCASIAACIF